ncbi:MAG: 2,3-bisphosphoglycerate-independent phosphoglycerate mutase [Paracoccaceae bacterium]
MATPKPVVLCILDGWGLRAEQTANAPALAHTPNFDCLMASCPNATLITHGPDVGLPIGQMGNSEVGHTNIGAGRIVAMDLGQIDLAIEDGSFSKNPALQDFIAVLKQCGGCAHLMGLASDGGVHGHITHIKAAVNAIAGAGVPVALHAVTDGRDVPPKSAEAFIAELEGALPERAFIATVSGRYFAMDRDHRWERVSKAYGAIIGGQGERYGSAAKYVQHAYSRGESDEFLNPAAISGYTGARNADGFFCLNFRADRVREILAAIGQPDFDRFDTGHRPKLAAMLGMVDYSCDHNAYMTTCYAKQRIKNTLGEWVAKRGLRQFRLAETEKYPHVTYFFNGGEEAPEAGEDRFMAKSPNVATYDLQPEMSAPEVTDRFIQAVENTYDLIIVNYANPDMVGHTGDLDAAIKACETVDICLGRALSALKTAGGAMIVTADHGNCEVMIDPHTGGPHTAHTTNLVPILVIGAPDGSGLRTGRLSDIAPTLLDLMDIPKPPEMTGESLLQRCSA